MTQPIQEIDFSRIKKDIKKGELKKLIWHLFSGKSKNVRARRGGISSKIPTQLSLPFEDKPKHKERSKKDVRADIMPPLPWKIQKKFFPAEIPKDIAPWIALNMSEDEYYWYKWHKEHNRYMNETNSIKLSELTDMIKEVVNEVASDPDSSIKSDEGLKLYFFLMDYVTMASDPKYNTIMAIKNAIIKRVKDPAELEAFKQIFNREFGGDHTTDKTAWDYHGDFDTGKVTEKITSNKALDAIQLALDIAGIPPSIGTPVNAVNTVISLLRAAKDKEHDERKKHLIDAGLNAISMVPFGSVVKLVKLRALRKPAAMAARAIKTGGEAAPRSYEPNVVQEDGEWHDSKQKDRKKETLPMEIDPTKIQAGKSQGFWLSPVGKTYQVGVNHAEFAVKYLHPELGNGAFDAMFRESWIRLRSHPEQKILEIEFLKSTPTQQKVIENIVKTLGYRTYLTKHKKHMEEGAGWGTTKDIKKDPKHIDDPKTGKMERWRIKFQSTKDLKKHGNTEKSPVNEGKEPKPLTPEAIAGIEKSMQRKGTRPTARRLVDIVLAGHLMGLTSGNLADTATFANGLDSIEQALVQGDFDGAINIAKETAEEMIRDEGGEGILGGEDDLDETVTKNELKEVIKELVNEMWVGWEQQNEAVNDFELGKQKAITDFKNKVPYKKNPVGLSARWIEGYRWAYGTLRRAAERGTGTQTPEQPEKDSQSDFGLGEGEEYDKWLNAYNGEECPKCKTFHKPGSADLKVLNPSNPTVHQCKCGHKWNPDNVKK